MMTVTRSNASANQRPTDRWIGLAVVARERASEQSAKAASASSTAVAEPHLEQQAYLLKLAELYEERARTIQSDTSDHARSTSEITTLQRWAGG